MEVRQKAAKIIRRELAKLEQAKDVEPDEWVAIEDMFRAVEKWEQVCGMKLEE